MMRWLRTVSHELFGLFVDDAGFALAILAWVGLMWGVLPHLGLPAPVHGPLLFAGLAAILIESALRRAGLTRKAPRR